MYAGVQKLTHTNPHICWLPHPKNRKPPHLRLTATTGKAVHCLHERPCFLMQMSNSLAIPHTPPPSWQSIPISTWIVFNYVPRGYHGSSISSVWQSNSLCPAAMSAKLRQFTCSCSYIALGKSHLPSILCIHLISGTHSLTPPTWAVTGVTKSKREVCLIFAAV